MQMSPDNTLLLTFLIFCATIQSDTVYVLCFLVFRPKTSKAPSLMPERKHRTLKGGYL